MIKWDLIIVIIILLFTSIFIIRKIILKILNKDKSGCSCSGEYNCCDKFNNKHRGY